MMLPSTRSTSTWPTGSNRRARAARDSGTNNAAPTIAAATIGTLTQKMKRQPKPSTRAPPRIGPSPSAKPDTEPNTPMALARSARAGNVVATIDIATGLSIVPPPASFAASTSHPTQVSTPARTGAPDDDGDQVTPARLSAPAVPKTPCSGERDGAVERRHEGW